MYLVAIVCLILAIVGAIEWYRPRLRRALVVSELKASRVSCGYNPISSLETIDGIVEPIFVDKRAHAKAAFHRLPLHWLTSGQKAPRPVLEKPVKPQPLKKARTKWL